MQNHILEQLAPYASMIVPEVPGDVRLNQLVYANQQDLVSTGLIPVTAGVISANSIVQLYSAALPGDVGQGFTTAVTLSQSNSLFNKGAAPKNQVYIATSFGFQIFACSSADADPSQPITENLLTPNSLFSFATNFSWDLTIGRGNVRTISTLLDRPACSGAWAASGDQGGGYGAQNGTPGCEMTRLVIPVVFPPLVNVDIQAACGSSFVVTDTGFTGFIGIRAIFAGALMTLPQG
jgi:hypothetical protein